MQPPSFFFFYIPPSPFFFPLFSPPPPPPPPPFPQGHPPSEASPAASIRLRTRQQSQAKVRSSSRRVLCSFSLCSSLSSSLCCISPQPDSPCWSPSADPSTPGDASRESRQGKGSSRCLLCSF